MITKLNNLIMPRYEAYRTRRVPLIIQRPFAVGTTAPACSSHADHLRSVTGSMPRHELMRFELPEDIGPT